MNKQELTTRKDVLELPVEAVFLLAANAAQGLKNTAPRALGFEYLGRTVGQGGENYICGRGEAVVDGEKTRCVRLVRQIDRHLGDGNGQVTTVIPTESLRRMRIEVDVVDIPGEDGQMLLSAELPAEDGEAGEGGEAVEPLDIRLLLAGYEAWRAEAVDRIEDDDLVGAFLAEMAAEAEAEVVRLTREELNDKSDEDLAKLVEEFEPLPVEGMSREDMIELYLLHVEAGDGVKDDSGEAGADLPV